MKRKNKQLLVENEYVKELLAVLKENPSPSGKDLLKWLPMLANWKTGWPRP